MRERITRSAAITGTEKNIPGTPPSCSPAITPKQNQYRMHFHARAHQERVEHVILKNAIDGEDHNQHTARADSR